MPHPVIDLGSNLEENLQRWARALKGAGAKLRVFNTVYSGKRSRWTPAEIVSLNPGLDGKRVTMVGKALHHDGLLKQLDVWPVVYEKIPEVHYYKNKILAAAGNRGRREGISTKRNPRVSVNVKFPNRKLDGKAIFISIDDIAEFRNVREISRKSVPRQMNPPRLSENDFKNGIISILSEHGTFKDWGGEQNDIFTPELTVANRRRMGAFALKGPAKTGKLTPGKMGKHGDQIQRLVASPAQVVLVQYEGQVEQSVFDLLKKLSRDRARTEGENIYYGVIDLQDSYRLRLAYPAAF